VICTIVRPVLVVGCHSTNLSTANIISN
jgi:hypothetical protein